MQLRLLKEFVHRVLHEWSVPTIREPGQVISHVGTRVDKSAALLRRVVRKVLLDVDAAIACGQLEKLSVPGVINVRLEELVHRICMPFFAFESTANFRDNLNRTALLGKTPKSQHFNIET